MANLGDFVEFGRYPQTLNDDIQPIEWQVLAKEENKMLLLSKYGLDTKRFDSSSNKWEYSEISYWANNYFYNKAFNEEEKKHIESFNGDNVFLLSKDEANKYFIYENVRICKPTKYALKHGAYVVVNKGYCFWWLSSSLASNLAYIVGCGVFTVNRVDTENNVFRPALWINL